MNRESNGQFLFDSNKVNNVLKSAKSIDDPFKDGGAIQSVFNSTPETMLKAELEDHLGYPHRDSKVTRSPAPHFQAENFC